MIEIDNHMRSIRTSLTSQTPSDVPIFHPISQPIHQTIKDCIRFAKICNDSGDPSNSTMKKHREYNTRFTLEKVRSILLT